MSIATKYNPTVAWRTIAANVVQVDRETSENPATYRAFVKAIDSNNPGSGQKDIGYFMVDNLGIPFRITSVSSDYVTVSDDFRTGSSPVSGKMAIIYKSVFNGRSHYLSPENFRHLHPLALSNSHRFDMALLWANDPNVKKVPFTASSQPTISDYQTDQEDPEDALKTLNYSEDYGEYPQIRLVITVDESTRYESQQKPQFTYVDGLIDTIFFDLGDELTGYILISK